ncbi:hypothetical protein [Microvirga tunisiensis]|uniref:Uncharacterized protein n=1 Tax=Microvirga tunisiensis TaxID=2108360 RepID=A0A5N7MYZ8_9HYPH|nr:hypothetical protein [Microvirga tunisiensis]MPR13665.1 hypothetical protein [Microvirga tunisiensis]MPR31579.1 hypothetical protein [Microvirga tunisiensis]
MRLITMSQRYKGFLDQTLGPAQRAFARDLQATDDWRQVWSPEGFQLIINEFNNFPCMNNPMEGHGERIMRFLPDWDPQLLFVMANRRSCLEAVNRQHPGLIQQRFRFRGTDGQPRMLAYEIPPCNHAFDRDTVATKYRAMGCRLVTSDNLTYCVVIPKTSSFRDDGAGFWSRPDVGEFDVLGLVKVGF